MLIFIILGQTAACVAILDAIFWHSQGFEVGSWSVRRGFVSQVRQEMIMKSPATFEVDR